MSQISISAVDVPNRVQPNTVVRADAEVSNNAEYVGFGPDVCNSGSMWPISGLSLEVVLLADGSEIDSATHCIGGMGHSKTYDLAWVSPSVSDSTSVTLEWVVRGASSGDEKARVSRTVTVAPDTPEQPDDTNDSGGSWPWENPNENPNDGGSTSVFTWLLNNQKKAAGILLVIAFLYLAGPFAEVAANATEGRG